MHVHQGKTQTAPLLTKFLGADQAIESCDIVFERRNGAASTPRTPTNSSQRYLSTAPIVVNGTTAFKVALSCPGRPGQSELDWLVTSLTFTKDE
jgi:hypothetical protein